MLDAALELVEPLNRFGQILEVTCVTCKHLKGMVVPRKSTQIRGKGLTFS